MKYLYLVILFILQTTVLAESKRIEVYATSQAYWDVHAGDTLSGIVNQLIKEASPSREKLTGEILSLNPDAFINANPNLLKANYRLWLPNGTNDMNELSSSQKYRIRNYSWGQVIQRK